MKIGSDLGAEKYADYIDDGETVDGVKIKTGDIFADNPEWYAAGQTWVGVGLAVLLLAFSVVLIVKKCSGKGI